MEKRRKNIVKLLALVALLLVIAGGATYAAWTYNFTGSLTNIISATGIEIDLLESEDEIIAINNALPMTDNEGLSQDEKFDFVVTSKASNDMVIGYTVSIEKLQADTGYTFLNDQDIKIYLEDFNGNVLLEPTKVSELSSYKLYVGTHIHNSTHETVQDKFRLKVWIDESKTNDARNWTTDTKLQYKFRLGVSSNETTAFTVNAVTTGGTITGSTSVGVVEGGNARFSMTPTNSSSEGLVSCTNSQTGVYKNNTLTVNNVTNDTTCTVTFTPASTVLYTDGTFIINEKASDRSANITEHGEVTNEYAPLSNSNTYVFSGTTSQPWNSKKTSVTNVEIGQHIEPTDTKNWFYGLTNMQAGDLTKLDTKSVTSMSNMFYQSGKNSSVTSFALTGLNNWDTSKVTNMSSMFYYAGQSATTWSIGDLSNWDTSKVTTMQYMFENAGYSATTFNIGDLSNWNTSSVSAIKRMFANAAYNVTTFELDLSNWDTSKVTDMDGMFYRAGYSATTFNIGDLSSWNTSKVTNMSGMFLSAGENATTWSIGDLSSWDTSSVTNMSYMFSDAGRSATTFNIGNLSNWDTSSVTNMSYMFSYAGRNSTTFDIGDLSNWNTSKTTTMAGMFINAGRNATTWRIGDLSNWTTSSVTNMYQMFYYAGYSATTWSIGDLSNWNTSNVTNMESMFDSAGLSTTSWSIGNLSNWDTQGVTTMKKMFYYAGRNATTWNSIGTLKVYATNIYQMFYDCSKAKATLNIYSNPASGSSGYDGAFYGAATDSSALITVNYSSATTNIDNIIATKSSNSNVVKGVQLD